MPELPEVRTFIEHLKRQGLIGIKIESVNCLKNKILKNCNLKQFEKFIIGETIKNINQLGKLIIIGLSHDKYLTIHLRMEGKLFLVDKKEKVQPYTMIELLAKTKKLIFLDTRMFGTFNIYSSKDELNKSNEVSKIGPQPFDKKLTSQYLFSCLNKTSRSIKTMLLDQSIIAGIGNIYADEILFACKINPKRPANKVSLNECENIIKSCQLIMNDAIKHHGTTVSSFAFAPNHAGSYQKYLKVHTRENEPCCICKTKIIKTTVNGRGTYYCPKCQNK